MHLAASFVYLAVALLSMGFASAYSKLSDATLQKLRDPGSDFNIQKGEILAPILIPRVSGTEGSIKVLNHFVSYFQKHLPDWKLEFQNSSSTTPTSKGQKIPFINLIATRDPPWARPGDVGRLALAAHYDSKLTPTGFIGATDSAAPCAMLLHAARGIDAALVRKWAKMQAAGAAEDDLEAASGIQILLLDGEEAFLSWTDEDSLYGSRSLAETWHETHNEPLATFHNRLSSISLFLLLDLLGAKKPTVPSYFKVTHWAYQRMAELEIRLRDLGLFKSISTRASKKERFLPEADKPNSQFYAGFMVEDDHIPFMKHGVEVLHVIPSPFPAVWHTAQDDGEHLDIPTVEDWAKLVTSFAAEWMELEGFIDAPTPQKKRKHADDDDDDAATGPAEKRKATNEKSELDAQ